MSDYGMSVIYEGTVEEAEEAMTVALKEIGFGILTRIDVAETLKQKISLKRRPYVILGACNPQYAAKAIAMEEEIGLLLPCNVIIYENDQGHTVVSAVDPERMFEVVKRDDMHGLAVEVRDLLNKAIESVRHS
jgi:uncharacterized protein (DUF302 family)